MADNIIQTVLTFRDEFTKQYSRAMNAADKKTKQAAKSIAKTEINVNNLKTAFIGLAGTVGLAAVGKAFVRVGQESESLTLQFETLLKSTEAAQQRMEELSTFASTTPFQLGEIAKASKVLQTLGGTSLATGESLRLVGDAAAISGENIQDLAVHVGRAYSGLQANRPIGESAARLQELGLVSGETRNRIEELQQQARGQEAWTVLQKALQANSGAMEKLSNTAGGMISTIKDQMEAGIRDMLNSGIWDLFKDALSDVRDQMDTLIKEGYFKDLGEGMLDLADFGNKAVVVLRTLWNVFQNGTSVIVNFGQILADVVKLSTSGIKGLALAVTGDFQSAFEATDGTVEEFTESFKANIEDIGNAVINNQRDIETAIKQGAQVQNAIEEARARSAKARAVDVREFIVGQKTQEAAQVVEIDRKLKNDLIAIQAENQLLASELSGADYQMRLDALENQKNAELAILDSQQEEELRKTNKNSLKRAQILNIFNQKRTKAELSYTKLVQAEQKARVSANLTGLSMVGNALEDLFGKNKAISSANALISTYEGANKALAQGGVLGPAAAALITAAGLKNVAKINGLGFQRGGIVPGLGTTDKNTPTFLTAGEGILTKDATNRVGAGGVQSINDRNVPTSNVTNSITYAPVINAFEGGQVLDALNNDYVRFADFLNEQLDKGLVNV